MAGSRQQLKPTSRHFPHFVLFFSLLVPFQACWLQSSTHGAPNLHGAVRKGHVRTVQCQGRWFESDLKSRSTEQSSLPSLTLRYCSLLAQWACILHICFVFRSLDVPNMHREIVPRGYGRRLRDPHVYDRDPLSLQSFLLPV